ncbi:MAG: MBL fold metallo-hydrolase, partial [Candidatus Omnitrophica bacterium]|nr:MBL fold metallo-hydrolase [Candidatus Omnitrophota bacterium]
MFTKMDKNFIKFLGTAGARFVMIRQLRHSGGLWVNVEGTNVLVDPGPGCLVHCANSRPKLDPSQLDAIILTHRHLDHCADVNVMIEAMTEGGYKKKGIVFCPKQALSDDPVILRYLRSFPQKIEILKEKTVYKVKNFKFSTSMQHIHPVETYGLKFKINALSIGLLTDTRYFKGLEKFYKTDILIIGVVFYEPHPGVDHLCLEDAQKLITQIKPQKAI